MKMRAGRGVPPQETGAGTEHRGRDHRLVERLSGTHVVDAVVPELGERDDHERREHERRRAGCEPVESVGQVDRVRRRVDHEQDEDEKARAAEVQVERPRERQVRVGVHEVHCEVREGGCDHHDAEGLAALAQPEIAAGAHAEIVVDPADDAEPDDQCEQ